MGKQLPNQRFLERLLSVSGDASAVTARGRAGLINCSLGIFLAILLGLVQGSIATNALYGQTAAGTAPKAQGTAANKPPAPRTAPAAAPKAAPADVRKPGAVLCGDKSKRYNDCGNGTVSDSLTGLIWLKDVNCLPAANWEAAKKEAADLKAGACGLSDGSAAGDWRLPTNLEWEATMKDAKAKGCSGPMLTNDAGDACASAGPTSFKDLEADYYWSSTPVEGGARIYMGDIDHGNILNGVPTNSIRVWPIRGVQK